MNNTVTECRTLGGYRLELKFDDGYQAVLDFESHLKNACGPMLRALSDAAVFQQARVDTELGTVTWPNHYDICPDTLRYWCELGRVCSQEELDAAFAPAAMELRDKRR